MKKHLKTFKTLLIFTAYWENGRKNRKNDMVYNIVPLF